MRAGLRALPSADTIGLPSKQTTTALSSEVLQQVRLVQSAIAGERFNALLEQMPLAHFEALQSTQFMFYRQTFWYPLRREPVNEFEQVIRQLHPVANPPAGVTGAEWWFSVTPINTTPLWLLPLHFDRANLREKNFSRIRHPDLGSVLFLNEVPYGDLVVTDQRLTEAGARPVQPGAMRFLRPAPNAYAVFPGHLLHGVIGRMREPVQPDRLRVSMAVNWWIEPPDPEYIHDSSEALRVFGLRH